MDELDDKRALQAIASVVGCEPFTAKPRDVYLRVRRYVHEHEAMRCRLARLVDDAEEAKRVLYDVDREDGE